MQQVVGMCSGFEANKSTKGASKLRRDLINGEIANLRDLLPLPSSTRQRLSQLQLMALVCVYVRKSNYFQQIMKRYPEMGHAYGLPNFGFSKALSGFLIMMTQNGKLLYISDNAAEYLGHSMEDLLIHGDSAYDIIDKADHATVQTELLRSSSTHNPPGQDTRLFLCRMNVSRNARRQMRFGDQKVVLVEGHFLPYHLPLVSRNEPVFVAVCTPVAMPETRECVVQGATNVFTSIHAIDMKFMHIDRNGEHYLGYTRAELAGISWYQLIHWNYMREAQSKHRLICQSEQEKSCILLLRLEARNGEWIWVHCVLQVKDGTDAPQSQQSVIVATNQVLSEREAAVMRANSWIYHYYTVQTKLQYGLAYQEAQGAGAAPGSPSAVAAAARLAAAAAYFPTSKLTMPHNGHQTPPYNLYHQATAGAGGHPTISPDSSSGYSPMPLHSPHPNGVYNTPGFSHSFELRNGKESPLDFSIAAAAAAAASPYEFPPGGYPSTGYWTHYHPHHGYVARADEGSTTTVLSTISASAGSPYAWSSLPGASLSASTNGTTQNHNHHHHHHQQPIHHQASLNTTPNNSTAVTNTSPSSSFILSNAKKSKRMKKSVEVQSESDLATVGPGGRGSSAAPDLSHMLDHGGDSRLTYGGTEMMMMTMTTPFTPHVRPRKLLLSTTTDEEETVVSEESMTMMTCPLTPSPIWEGQTQRVPDLQLYSSSGSERDPSESVAGGGSSADLSHRVPSMQLWNHALPPPGHFR